MMSYGTVCTLAFTLHLFRLCDPSFCKCIFKTSDPFRHRNFASITFCGHQWALRVTTLGWYGSELLNIRYTSLLSIKP